MEVFGFSKDLITRNILNSELTGINDGATT